MRALKSLLASGAFLLLCGVSAAMADDEIKCNADGNQAEMNMCAYDDLAEADAALNVTYKKAMAFAREQDENFKDQPNLQGAVAALKKAQRAWIEYRDGHCDGYGFGARGGSMEPMLVAGCQTDLTKKRTAELQDLMDYPDGEGK